MNISKLLPGAYQKLIKTKINSAHIDAELLLSFIIKKPREYILAHPEINLTKKQVGKFNNLINQRAKNIPVAYLLKEKEFYGRKFYVDKRVLVPRPETEDQVTNTKLQVTNQITRNKLQETRNTAIIDVGTGSGCIIITLVKELENLQSAICNLKFIAIDISKDALTVARKNAHLHKVDKKIKFIQGNLLEPVLSFLRTLPTGRQEQESKKFINIIITANLPYLTPKEIKNSSSIKHEPKLALLAGKDGLKYYRELAKQIKKLETKNSKLNITLICEIGDKQASEIKRIFSSIVIPGVSKRRLGIQKKNITIKKDLAGRDRIVVIKI